jgi:hypothetical protein
MRPSSLQTAIVPTVCALLVLPGCLFVPPKGNSAPAGGGVQPTTNAAEETEEAPGLGGPSGGGGSGAPELDSITLHNDCASTVKLFLGEKPKFGSGTSTSITSNATQAFTLQPGKSLWIVSATDEGVAQYVGQAGTHRMRIPASCKEFVAD